MANMEFHIYERNLEPQNWERGKWFSIVHTVMAIIASLFTSSVTPSAMLWNKFWVQNGQVILKKGSKHSEHCFITKCVKSFTSAVMVLGAVKGCILLLARLTSVLRGGKMSIS